jgi:putative ABC transport system substrate-binding protein
LVHRQVTVIVTGGGEAAARAARTATSVVPIVFNTGTDPIKAGLVASLGRPGGNATGINLFTTELAAKRLGLLHDLIPTGALVAVLLNPNFPAAEANARELEAAARGVGRPTHIVTAGSESELDAAFETIVQMGAGAILVGVDPFFYSRRDQIVALAARHAIPAIYEQREFAIAGGLMSYGTSLGDGYRQQGIYAGRVLNGEKPSELPVIQLSKFELVINLKTAKALALTFPPGLLAIADEVIE